MALDFLDMWKTTFGLWLENSLLILKVTFKFAQLTAVVLAGRWGDVTNAGGELAFPLMWWVPGTITGTAAVARVLTASAGTMQAHLPLFGLPTRCSGLAAAFRDRRSQDIRLCFSGPVDSFTKEEFIDLAHHSWVFLTTKTKRNNITMDSEQCSFFLNIDLLSSIVYL